MTPCSPEIGGVILQNNSGLKTTADTIKTIVIARKGTVAIVTVPGVDSRSFMIIELARIQEGTRAVDLIWPNSPQLTTIGL